MDGALYFRIGHVEVDFVNLHCRIQSVIVIDAKKRAFSHVDFHPPAGRRERQKVFPPVGDCGTGLWDPPRRELPRSDDLVWPARDGIHPKREEIEVVTLQ